MSSRGGAVRQPHALQQDRAPPSTVATATRWLVEHERASAGLLFGLFVLIYLWPVLIGGNVLSPRSVLFQYPPWQTSAPAGWEMGTNFILGDVPMSHYPFHVLVRAFLHEGTFPAWSQHAYAGVPFFTNPQTLVLSPFALPIWLLPLEFGIGLSAAIKLWVAAFGMYMLVRELRLDFWPAVLAGLSYALCAFSVVWLTHETLLAVSAILPWMILLSERIVRRGGLGPTIGLVVASAMVMTGGHPGAQVHVMLATGIYALVRLFNVSDLVREDRVRRGALIAGGTILGVLLSAVLLIPVVKAGTDTIGIQARSGLNLTIPGADMPLGTIRTALFPDWWGRPTDLSLAGPANYNERTYYAGGIATLFALFALISPGMWRRKAPFAAIGFIGLSVPLHMPVLFWLATHVPIVRQVQFQRMMLLYAFAAAVLAAFGLQRLLDEGGRERWRMLGVLAAAGGIGLVALAGASVTGADLRHGVGDILHLRHAIGGLIPGSDPNVGGLVATSVLWWLVLVAGVAAAVAALWRWPHRAAHVVVALVALAALDLQYIAHDYQPMKPASQVTPPRTPAIAYLQRHAADGRFVGIQGAVLNDWGSIYGLRDVRGSEPPQPSLRWFHLWKTAVEPQQPDWSQALVQALPSASGINALSVFGARYIVTAPGAKTSPEVPQLSIGYSGPDATVYVNRDAPPRAMVAPHVLLTGNEDETVGAITNIEFDPRQQAIVERSEPGASALSETSGAGGRVAVAHESATTVTLAASLQHPGLVVLNDALAPGWSVTVDGRAADPVRVDDVMRGVAADAGHHVIEWRYRVPGLRLGLAVTVAALLALLALTGVMLRTRRQALGPR